MTEPDTASFPVPTQATVAADAAALGVDIATSVRGPVLTGHLATFLVDTAVLVGVLPSWLPESVAVHLAAFGIGLAVMAAGHLYAWFQSVEKAKRQHAAVTAPAVALGRHARH